MNEDDIIKLPIWKEKYEKLGVTPRELYMRQQGLCWLESETEEGTRVIYCTDGKDKAKTDCMLNPTLECVKCMTGYLTKELDRK